MQYTETRADDNLQRLIERLEAATGPDRVLDMDIEEAALPELRRKPWRRDLGRFWDDSDRDGLHYVEASRYTASIDAALTLVPEGSEWTRHRGANDRMTMQIDGPSHFGVHGQGATPAIALCIAALRARAAA